MGQEYSLHALPVVECPGVGRRCKLSAPNPRPTISTALTYRCNRCGTETVRVFKTPMNSNGAPSPARRAVTRPVMRSISEFAMIRIIRERHHNLRSVGVSDPSVNQP